MYEFKSNPENIITTKKLPESHQELEKIEPNDMAVIIKKLEEY